jgi:tetratricopeptide (TPR) repeat protein
MSHRYNPHMPDAPSAETAYLFRHVLLREVAYQIQLPGDRAKLHALALRLLQDLLETPPLPAPDSFGDRQFQPHAMDGAAEELAVHAKMAQLSAGEDLAALREAELHYLWRAAVFARQRCDNARSIQLFEAAAMHPAADSVLRISALREHGWMLHTTAQPAVGLKSLEQALAIARETCFTIEEARLLGILGLVAADSGNRDEASRLYRQALELQRLGAPPTDTSRTLTYLAAGMRDDFAASEAMFREAIELAQQGGDDRGVGVALANLAVRLVDQGRNSEGEATYREALLIQRKIGNKRIEGIVLANLALLLEEDNRLEEAERLYEQALECHRLYGNRRSEGFALGNLATLYGRTGRPELARRTFEQALEIHAQLGARWNLAVHQCDYAVFLLGLGETTRAKELWQAGSQSLEKMGDKLELADKQKYMREACRKAGVEPLDNLG